MLISYNELIEDVVGRGYITGLTDISQVNGSSIDVRLGQDLLIEQPPQTVCPKCGTKSDGVRKNMLSGRAVWKDYFFCAGCPYGGPLSTFVKPIDFSKKEPLNMESVDCTNGFALWPGEVCLAHTVEVFNLPMHVSADFHLKSSQARIFLEHLHAGFMDPGWHGSVLTLEFCNMSKYHPLLLEAGMKCGQVTFYRHEAVPEDRSYAARGQYNNCGTVTPSRGVK